MVFILMIYSPEADWTHQSAEDFMAVQVGHKALEDALR